MAWNGSGVFSRLYNWVNDRDAGTKILATKMDAEMDGFTTGINNCLTKDGQNSPTTDLDMDGNKHTDVGNGSARTHYSAVGQVQDGAFRYAAVSGTDTYTMTLSPAITAYAAGQVFYGLVTNANTGASTLNVNSVGAKNIYDLKGGALSGGEIPAGAIVHVVYDGTQFILISAKATSASSGLVELATTAEIDTGTDAERAVTPAGIVHVIDGSSTQKIQTAAYAAGSVDQAAIGAGAVDQSAIGAGAVGQGELKTAPASHSVVIASGSSSTQALTGGTYSWWTMGGTEGTSNTDHIVVGGSGDTAAGTLGLRNQETASNTCYIDERYVQASPPYDLGDGEIPLFIYLLMSGGNIEGVSVAPDPTWAYHGPTDIRAQHVDRVTGRKYRRQRILPNGMTLREAKLQAPAIYRQFQTGQIDAIIELIEITQAYKNQDKDIAPHPWYLNDNSGKQVVLLDPVSSISSRLADIADDEGAREVRELIQGNYLVVDNSDNGRNSAAGVMPVNFRWKNTGGA